MLSKIWNQLSLNGTTAVSDHSERRSIILSNRFLLLVFLINLLLFFIVVSISGFGPFARMLIIGNISSFIIIWSLTRLGYTVLARVLFSWMVSMFTFATALISKLDANMVNDSEFYAPRIYIIITAVIPVLIFSTKRKWGLTVSLAGSFITLLFFDPVHNFFGVGYYQSGYSSPSYPLITFITLAGYFIVIITLITYKAIIEKYELEQRELTASLTEKNTIIEDQKAQLETTNLELVEELSEKNLELSRTISELKQFSYTLSHNLRSPVASLLGLTSLIDTNDTRLDDELKVILSHIRQSSKNLDETISDLRNILDIRDNIAQAKETFMVSDEIEKILAVLNEEITNNEVTINLSSKASEPILSFKAYVHSILYNLISNAIKFRTPGKSHVVCIDIEQDKTMLNISVKDNGTGMDLEKNGEQLFMMYKRLNTHQPGKGLGLYITNFQVEFLQGSIDVTSAPGKGSTFDVKIPLQ